MIRKNGCGIIIPCLIVSDWFRDAYRTTLGRLLFHMHLRYPWRMRLRFRSISFGEHRAPHTVPQVPPQFLLPWPKCVLPVIILPLYVNRINNYLNTQLQISWRVSVVGKIKPRRFAIREFWVKYLLTSIMILAKLLTFYYWDDSVSPWFFPTKILSARWVFWNSEFFRVFIKVICCIYYVGQHKPSMTRALLQKQSYYYLCSKICQYLRK